MGIKIILKNLRKLFRVKPQMSKEELRLHYLLHYLMTQILKNSGILLILIKEVKASENIYLNSMNSCQMLKMIVLKSKHKKLSIIMILCNYHLNKLNCHIHHLIIILLIYPWIIINQVVIIIHLILVLILLRLNLSEKIKLLAINKMDKKLRKIEH